MVRDYLSFLDAPGEFHDFLDEFQEESERAAAVLGGAFLDDQLGELIGRSLAEEEVVEDLLGRTRPLSSFGARITAAQGLGLITPAEARDLDRVREIRNRFAHRVHGLSFEAPEIADRCRVFECNEERFAALDGFREAYPTSPRDLFNLAVALLAFYLARRIEHTEPFESANPPLWPFPDELAKEA